MEEVSIFSTILHTVDNVRVIVPNSAIIGGNIMNYSANDLRRVDLVAGIPDSGTGHAIGYANQAGVPYRRPFVKYTPTPTMAAR